MITEKIVDYIKNMMLVISFGTAIWAMSAKSTSTKVQVDDLKEDISDIKENMLTNTTLINFQDSMFAAVAVMKTDIITVTKSQNALRNSYVRWAKDHTKEYDELMKYLQVIEFELVVPKVDSTDLKIKIRKVK
jgi:hypothetical protein